MVLVDLIRNNDWGQRIESDFGLTQRAERPLYSTVTEGNLLALGAGWGWGTMIWGTTVGLTAAV